MSRRIGHITIALATLVLSGCGADNPAPPPLPTASQSASPTAATPPVMPDSARGTTRAAAKEFVRYYVAVMSYATRTGETSELSKLSGNKCRSCRTIIEAVKTMYTGGGSASGEGYAVSNLRAHQTAGRVIAVDCTLTTMPQVAIPSAGASPQSYPRSEIGASFVLSPTNDGWKVLEWDRVEA